MMIKINLYPNKRIIKGHDASFALLVSCWMNNDEICIKVKRKDFTNQNDNQEDFQKKIIYF